MLLLLGAAAVLGSAVTITLLQLLFTRRHLTVLDAQKRPPQLSLGSSQEEKIQYLIDWLQLQRQEGNIQFGKSEPSWGRKFLGNLGWNIFSILVGWGLNTLVCYVTLPHP